MSGHPIAMDIDPLLLGEAADWLMRFQSGNDSAELRRNFEQWQARSPAHAAAWQRAEAVLNTFRQIPPGIGRRTLGAPDKPGRRRALHALGLFAIAAPAAWLAWHDRPWAEWSADLRTATGEQKTLDLADGTRLVLNTASAVDVAFRAGERRLRLIRGEILVTTGKDPLPQPRPFIVQTAEGSIRPIGTRFSVRQLPGETRTAVLAGAVEITTGDGRQLLLSAGEQASFFSGRIGQATSVAASAVLWEQGMLVASDMPLATLIAELGRYRPGVLRCHPAVAELRVSGAFPLRDTDASLDLLIKTRPLALRSVTRYWVSVEAR